MGTPPGTGQPSDLSGTSSTPPLEGAEKRVAMSKGWIRFLAYYYSILVVLLMVLLAKLWPRTIPLRQGVPHEVGFFWGPISISQELQLILIVVLAGALGSYVHGATSFVQFTGDRSIVASWRWWYILRPFIGSALALGFYFVVRAGFFAGSSDTSTFNVVGFAATAFLAGMFSRQAIEKLAELFDKMFGTPSEYQSKEDKH